MLKPMQFIICGLLATVFWVLATLCIHFNPASVTAGLQGNISFVLSLPVCWFSIWLTCKLAYLKPDQIMTGCLIVLGDAMLIDGVALRWVHSIYTVNDTTGRFGAAWLLWGYGISAWIIVLMANRKVRGATITAR